jgi:hypothetical protein
MVWERLSKWFLKIRRFLRDEKNREMNYPEELLPKNNFKKNRS